MACVSQVSEILPSQEDLNVVETPAVARPFGRLSNHLRNRTWRVRARDVRIDAPFVAMIAANLTYDLEKISVSDLERLVVSDMTHNAAVVATFVYLTANRDQKLPRKTPPTVQ